MAVSLSTLVGVLSRGKSSGRYNRTVFASGQPSGLAKKGEISGCFRKQKVQPWDGNSEWQPVINTKRSPWPAETMRLERAEKMLLRVWMNCFCLGVLCSSWTGSFFFSSLSEQGLKAVYLFLFCLFTATSVDFAFSLERPFLHQKLQQHKKLQLLLECLEVESKGFRLAEHSTEVFRKKCRLQWW